jgi:hypothetical protein
VLREYNDGQALALELLRRLTEPPRVIDQFADVVLARERADVVYGLELEVATQVTTCQRSYATERNSTHHAEPRRAEHPKPDVVRVPPPGASLNARRERAFVVRAASSSQGDAQPSSWRSALHPPDERRDVPVWTLLG